MLSIRHQAEGPIAQMVSESPPVCHDLSVVRLWVCVRPESRWVEVECVCGDISRAAGAQDYLELARSAWLSMPVVTELPAA